MCALGGEQLMRVFFSQVYSKLNDDKKYPTKNVRWKYENSLSIYIFFLWI